MSDQVAQRLERMTPLQRAVFALKETQARLDAIQRQRSEPIAIVGMACRLPGGAIDAASYWRLMCDSVEAIREMPADRFDVDAYFDPDPAAPGKMNTRWGGFLDRVDEFDNHFFGISDQEASRIDPQQRIILELAWEALEDAGLPPRTLRGSGAGVFMGISASDYSVLLCTDRDQTDGYAAAGTSLCLAANRVSFALGLHGPSMAIDTACSSSLVAIHLACQYLRNGECELALAGGANVLLSPVGMINLTKAGISAPDGKVRSFDAAASGYVRSEGAGVVVLKPLSAALQHRDPIHAIILGSAVNQNGTSNGQTAPSRPAQEQVLREAYRRAQVSPGQIQYVEAHATGTRLGDAIEAFALGTVLAENRAAGSRCIVGSVKTNLGHTEAASGVASVMKAALALKHRQVPPNLHFQTPSPDIPFDKLPLRIPRQLEPWPDTSGPRLAGVSAFGFGGSNAHLVLQEAPVEAVGSVSDPSSPADVSSSAKPLDLAGSSGAIGRLGEPSYTVLPISARTEKALRDLAASYVKFLGSDPPAWRDVCFTAAQRREHHDCRLALLADSPEKAIELLEAFLRDPSRAGSSDGATLSQVMVGRRPYGRDLKIAFLFGEGAEAWTPHIARLVDAVPGLSAHLERIAASAGYAETPSSLWNQANRWSEPAYARPALLTLQLAMAAWWQGLGVAAESVLGRGVGELAAACTAGVLAADEIVRRLASGAMPAPAVRAASLPFVSALDGRLHRGADFEAGHWSRCLQAETGWNAGLDVLRDRRVDVCLEMGPSQEASSLDGWTNPEGRPTQRVPSLRTAGGAPDVLAAVGTLYAAGADIRWNSIVPPGGRCVRVPTYPWQRQRLWAAKPPARGSKATATQAKSDATAAKLGAAEAIRPRPDLTVPYVAPRNPVEEEIARAWCGVLHLEQVGVHDSFFELGGDSLQVAQLLNRLRERLGAAIPLREVYESPTIARLAEHVATAAQGTEGAADAIPRAPRDGVLLPSLTQEALWFLDQMERERPTYTIYSPLRIRGPLSIASAERALNEISARHEILRTTFPEVDGRPVQAIARPEPRPLPVVDLSHLGEPERTAELQRRIAQEMERPVDLQKGPLIRITLFRLSEEDHVAVLSTHHIIYDGWSMAVLLRELTALYAAFEAGRPSPLADLPIQYADFAAWQRERLSGERFEPLRDYWRKQLTGVGPLELPTDQPRPAVRTTRGAVRTMTLAPETGAAVAEFCRREGVTPFMAFLAVLDVLLHRYSGQEDFAIGSPVANRTRPETEMLIGYFVNVLVLRGDLSGGPTFRELLQRTRQMTLSAYEHQEMTLDQVVDVVNPPRDLGRHPLFQVMFALQNFELAATEHFGLTIAPLDDGPMSRSSFFDLTLELWPAEGTYRADWYFATDLFSPETIDRMAQQYERLVAAAVADPDRPVSELPLLSEADQRQILADWNDTAKPLARERCIHQCFEDQAEKTPEATAVASGDARWTYRELNERSNRLARLLRAQGVTEETRVAICLERSPELLMAVLGVLKAGGAYVPLDPAYTRDAEERMRYVLQDAQVSLVVTSRELAGSIDAGQIPLVVLDGDAAQSICGQDPGRLEPAATLDNLAYVLYTSGSTGRPKGVMVTHGNLLNAFAGWKDAYRLDTDVRVHLQMASFGFDVFGGDLVRALGSGGTLVICPKETLLDAKALLDLMRRERVDIAEFVPVVLRNLVQHLEETRQSLDFMRLVIVGSDAWHVADHNRTRRVLGPNTRLINSYGLTETTIDSTYFEGDVSALAEAALVPIGRAFPNVRLYILDGRMQPAPIGVPGELYIGGLGVSRGYIDAALNAERFPSDPFAAQPGARMCRTGDRARWRTDGQVEFLGRADNQVKIRGFRVEPGEVERVLQEHPLLAQAAVVARERTAGDLRLAAYVVGKGGAAPDAAELRAYLTPRVPDYMVPSAFVVMDALPMTTSGKVNRRALPAPEWTQGARERDFVAPRNQTERRLAEIWEELLDVRPVGVRDTFFDLGGNSLLAMRLVSRIANSGSFARGVSIRDVFVHQTVAELARLLDPTDTADTAAADAPASASAMSLFTASAAPWTAPGVRFAEVEREPLEELIRAGRLAPVDSAALAYWPARWLENIPQLPLLIEAGWLARRPLLADVSQTPWGRIATIMLPVFDSELYADTNRLVRHAVEGLELAGSLGARMVSLTGLIPSATDNGRALLAAMVDRDDLPRPTTGHATTASAVVLSIRRALAEAGRDLRDERVAYLGLGSIGYATLRLMMASQPHPSEIILSDLFSKQEMLGTIRKELIAQFGFTGEIRVLSSTGQVPEELYEATTIIGATNVPAVLDVERIRPGTIIVDDSAPHSFRPDAAIERFEKSADILFTEGGVLKSPEPIRQSRYLPPPLDSLLSPEAVHALTFYHPLQITGCVFSGLLSSQFEEIRPTVGAVDVESLSRNFAKLDELRFEGADLHCDGYVLDRERIRRFQRFRPSTAIRPRALSSVAAPSSNHGGNLIVPLRTAGSAPPLFCVHGLGGHVGAFLPLAQALAEGRPVYGVQAQGLEPGQQPQDTIEAMAATYVDEIRREQPHGPYWLSGWSLGGLIALEMARRLEAAGEEVALLAMLDTHLSIADYEALGLVGQSAIPSLAQRLEIAMPELSGLPLEEQWKRIAEKADGVPGDEAAEIRRLAAVCLAQLKAASRYEPEPYGGRVVLLRAAKAQPELDRRWQMLCPHVEADTVPGDHYSMLRPPDVIAVAERLGRCLDGRALCREGERRETIEKTVH